jgi:hypothetical protein
MKKNYIAPQMEQVTIELSTMLAASEKVGVFASEKDEVDASESLSNERRGWGDLWN